MTSARMMITRQLSWALDFNSQRRTIPITLAALSFLLPISSPAQDSAVGSSIECYVMQNPEFGYILTRTSDDQASLISFWPDRETKEIRKDAPENALKGAFETTNDSSLIKAALDIRQTKNWGVHADIAINLSGKDMELRDGEGIISLATLEYNDNDEVVNADFAPLMRLECGGKKVKRVPRAYCTRRTFGGAICDVMYQ